MTNNLTVLTRVPNGRQQLGVLVGGTRAGEGDQSGQDRTDNQLLPPRIARWALECLYGDVTGNQDAIAPSGSTRHEIC